MSVVVGAHAIATGTRDGQTNCLNLENCTEYLTTAAGDRFSWTVRVREGSSESYALEHTAESYL
jgi:hypothetical protein